MNSKTTYYVDESGDMTFFSKRGKPISFDTPGVARFFMLGVVKIKDDIETVTKKFNDLRNDLLADPFLKGVPSIRKTALMFHAKDDCAIVRREVFKLLKEINVSVHIALIRKEVRLKNAITLYHLKRKKTLFSEREVYTDLTKRIFRNLLHKSDCDIIVAQRGKTFTTQNIRDALERAKINFYNAHNIEVKSDITPILSQPSDYIGLQIIDYYLWAIKKLYEDSDISFFNLLREDYKIIYDIDDTRKEGYGVYYSRSNEIALDKIKEAS